MRMMVQGVPFFSYMNNYSVVFMFNVMWPRWSQMGLWVGLISCTAYPDSINKHTPITIAMNDAPYSLVSTVEQEGEGDGTPPILGGASVSPAVIDTHAAAQRVVLIISFLSEPAEQAPLASCTVVWAHGEGGRHTDELLAADALQTVNDTSDVFAWTIAWSQYVLPPLPIPKTPSPSQTPNTSARMFLCIPVRDTCSCPLLLSSCV